MAKKKNNKKWFQKATAGSPDTGWSKTMGQMKRRRLMLQAHGGDYLASGRAMTALANVTQDAETRRKASADAKYFYTKHRLRKGK